MNQKLLLDLIRDGYRLILASKSTGQISSARTEQAQGESFQHILKGAKAKARRDVMRKLLEQGLPLR